MKRQAQKSALTILDTMQDPALFGTWFQGESWSAWKVFLSALFGLRIDKAAMKIYQRHTGRKSAPEGPCKEAWLRSRGVTTRPGNLQQGGGAIPLPHFRRCVAGQM